MCALGMNPPKASDCYDYIIGAYKIDRKVARLIREAKDDCDVALNQVQEYFRTSTTDPPRVVGKIGSTTRQQDYDTTKIVKKYSPAHLQKRRILLTSPADSAITLISKMFDSAGLSDVQLKAENKFIITYGQLNLTPEGWKDVVNRLNAYYRFYVDTLGMKEPDSYIQVFLAKDIKELQDVSKKLHGFIPPAYTLGYSSLEDQSIISIAYVPQKPVMGTACHELFHILSKNTYESLPPWLEEGMASLYEVSQPRGLNIAGLNNWRIQFLRGKSQNEFTKLDHYDLNRMLSMTWNEFNEPDGSSEALQSFNYAYSRYLMLYLQEKGTLPQFFKKAASYRFKDIVNGPVSDYTAMIHQFSGTGHNFDLNFRNWVKAQPWVEH
jgi:hypothetical protein